ncbi:ankyrin [Flagelloscypha sp. PMI_526]|nr:ankyrin [Flagelloscypha sp. PMI_526]
MASSLSQKNIWVAAGDGDLDRVRELVESVGIHPNSPDPYTYTPIHAAASYGHIHVLEYLLEKGGNVNITDSDGDTPLYTVETTATAQYLVQHGAIVDRVNNDGISPIEHLSEDFPAVSAFLQSHSTQTPASALATPSGISSLPSQHAQNQVTESLTTSLLESVQQLHSQSNGEPDEEELRRVVSEAVLQGMTTGYQLSGTLADEQPQNAGQTRRLDNAGASENKRPRTEE